MESSREKLQVWLDCDPGLDDIMAIILAACDERINLLGVSTSPGNSTLDNTTRNALDVLDIIGRADVPVIMGSPKPFSTTIVYGGHMHGDNGLGGLEIPHTTKKSISEDRFSVIYKLIMQSPSKVAFVNTGSLTNLAILLASHPDLKDKLSEISIMGGAIGEGNITPAAEFNIFFDAVAAQECLSYGIPFTMVPLQVTHTVQANDKVMQKLAQFKSELGKTLLQLLQIYQKNYKTFYNIPYPPIHDPCAVFYLLEREKFQGRQCKVTIDTFPISNGRTNCKFRYTSEEKPNCFVTEKVNVDRFWEVMLAAYAKCVPRE